ncbi:diacylglycerol/lipid kinase family protein [Flavobacterium rhizosphaerae]|uniref:YegS/Rv2252/BmrU family lipid kinase n=1 Tax=Flavobacterium rhizosphaerae TaxID=3163298 RepID=A0ABW8YX91_9FLAO
MSLQDKFILVVNPISGGHDKTELLESVKQYAQDKGVTLIEYETTGDNDEEVIKQLCIKHNPPRILVAGGDGTIKMVAEALEKRDIIIGVLPAGSANGLSVDLELPEDVDEIIETAFNGKPMAMDMVSINKKMSLHLSDLGANAELIKNYEGGKLRGKLGYALQAFNTLKELGDPFEADIKANGETMRTEARMIVIANTKRYGTGVTINPIGKMDDGKFEIVILKSLDPILIGKILTGNMPVKDDENVDIISTQEALIETNAPVSFQIDGEYCGLTDKLDIKILHKQMKVSVPNF